MKLVRIQFSFECAIDKLSIILDNIKRANINIMGYCIEEIKNVKLVVGLVNNTMYDKNWNKKVKLILKTHNINYEKKKVLQILTNSQSQPGILSQYYNEFLKQNIIVNNAYVGENNSLIFDLNNTHYIIR